jgi:DNA primase
VAKIEGIPIRDAALKLQEWFGPKAGEHGKGDRVGVPTGVSKKPVQSRPQKLAKEKKEEIKNPPLTFVLKHLDHEHPYLATRGLTTKTIQEFGLGYCTKGLMQGRIAIPVHNENGSWWPMLVAGLGSHLKEKGSINFHRVRALAQTQSLLLVEGFFDCMRLWQAGIHNVVGLMGRSLSPEQEALIVEAAGPYGTVTLLFDEDEAGRTCRIDALTWLSIHVYVKVISLGAEGAQPDSFTAEEVKNLGLL